MLCDLDGTLVDSAADLTAALNTVLQTHGRITLTLAEVKAMIGDGVARLVEKGFAATGESPSAALMQQAGKQFLDLYQEQPVVLSSLFPGVMETLLELKESDYTLVICSNKLEHLARQIVSHLGIASFFEDIVGGDTFSVCKPQPGHLLETLKRLQRSSHSAVMIGDSQHDVSAARGAGIPVIFASYGYASQTAHDLAPDEVIDTFSALPQALASLQSRI